VFRDTLLRHWYRGKILKRLDGRRLARYPGDYRSRFLDVVTPIAQARFGPGVEDGLPFPLRIRSALLRAGRRDDLFRFAEFEAALECRAEVTSARWARSGKLKLTIHVRVVRDEEDAIVFDVRKSLAGPAIAPALAVDWQPSIWRPPGHLGLDFLPRNALDARRDLHLDRVDLFLRDKATNTERWIPGRAQRNLVHASVTIDPLHVFSRSDPSLGGQLVAYVRHAGWTFETPLRATQAILEDTRRSPVLAGRKCELVARSDGTVELRRDWPAGRVRDLAARAVPRASRLARKAVPHQVRRVLSRLRNAHHNPFWSDSDTQKRVGQDRR
jgi:hypothetical protein